MHKCINCNNLVKDEVKVDIREIIASNFQYGMQMDGVLLHVRIGCTGVYIIDQSCMTLIYCCRTDDFCDYVKQKILLDWQFCQYGETKAHFVCPDCGKRTMALYSSRISFMCRKCYSKYKARGLSDCAQTAMINAKLKSEAITIADWQLVNGA